MIPIEGLDGFYLRHQYLYWLTLRAQSIYGKSLPAQFISQTFINLCLRAVASSNTLTCKYPELLTYVEQARVHIHPVVDANFEGLGQIINARSHMVLTVFQNSLTRHLPTRQAKAITAFLSTHYPVDNKSLFGFLHNVITWRINGAHDALKPNPNLYKAKDLCLEAENTILATTQVADLVALHREQVLVVGMSAAPEQTLATPTG